MAIMAVYRNVVVMASLDTVRKSGFLFRSSDFQRLLAQLRSAKICICSSAEYVCIVCI
jgi:hypothetical protein